ncbi:MAG: hypothetical protein MZV65_20535 [Chromatiales bacterium]|nr:hypothetical protein [Chromatiales bacterium]
MSGTAGAGADAARRAASMRTAQSARSALRIVALRSRRARRARAVVFILWRPGCASEARARRPPNAAADRPQLAAAWRRGMFALRLRAGAAVRRDLRGHRPRHGKTRVAPARPSTRGRTRRALVTVEFIASVPRGLPWEFRAGSRADAACTRASCTRRSSSRRNRPADDRSPARRCRASRRRKAAQYFQQDRVLLLHASRRSRPGEAARDAACGSSSTRTLPTRRATASRCPTRSSTVDSAAAR